MEASGTTLILIYVVNIMIKVWSNAQKILAVIRCLLKSY